MHCDDVKSGDVKDFATYQAAWKASPRTSTCSSEAPYDQNGLQLTGAEKTALITAYGPKAKQDSLSNLFNICGGVENLYVRIIVNAHQAKEAAGALIICPDHPNANKMQANIDLLPDLRAAGVDKNTDPSDIITYQITGSASSALVTYSLDGGSIGQENDVPLPWTKVLVITGSDRYLSVSAQNSGDGEITCTIKVQGYDHVTVTSKGAYAIADCSGP